MHFLDLRHYFQTTAQYTSADYSLQFLDNFNFSESFAPTYLVVIKHECENLILASVVIAELPIEHGLLFVSFGPSFLDKWNLWEVTHVKTGHAGGALMLLAADQVVTHLAI